MHRTSSQRGFTLIEIMVAVAIVGTLAAVAVPLLMGSSDRSKASEAAVQLAKLEASAKMYFNDHGRFPQGTAEVLPGPDGHACRPSNHTFDVTQDWTDDTIWSGLDFAITEPNRFSYHYQSTSSGAVIWAVADLRCNGTLTIQRIDLVGESDPEEIAMGDTSPPGVGSSGPMGVLQSDPGDSGDPGDSSASTAPTGSSGPSGPGSSDSSGSSGSSSYENGSN